MVAIAGHEQQIEHMPVAGAKPSTTEPWVTCGCGWHAPIRTALRSNVSLVARMKHLEHLVEVFSGVDVSQ